MTVAWPDALLVERCSPELRNFAASGGRTGNGREQRVFHDAGFWEIGFDLQLRDEDQVLAYQALRARLRQGEDVLVKVPVKQRPRGDRSARIETAALLRATTLRILGIGAELRAGHYLSVGDRLHLITEIVSRTPNAASAWDDGGQWSDTFGPVTEVKVLPPLRASVPAGTIVSFADLVCLCVLKDMGEGDLSLDVALVGAPSMTFIEAI